MASAGGDNGETLALNIMPLMDIFSILILFLLMSFSTDPVTHDVNEGIELPDSKTIRSLDEVPALIVSKTDIIVGEKKVTSIINGDIQKRDLSQGAIDPLYNELMKLAEANKRYSKSENKKKTSVLTMEMDKSLEFLIMRRVMLSAQQADFITFKLMVAKEH